MKSSKTIFLIIFTAILFACTITIEGDEYQAIIKKCQSNDNKSDPACVILSSNEPLEDKYNSIGLLYIAGTPPYQENCIKAKYWFEKSYAENLNYPYAPNSLGFIYKICPEYKDNKKAEAFYLKAIANGEQRDAKSNLAELYRSQGKYNQALYWFEKAIDENPYRGYIGVAGVYIDQKNYPKAKEYLLKSAEFNHPEALYNLGVIYYDGYGVEVDKAVAKEWFLKALKQGNERANAYLPELEDIKVD